MATDSSTEHDTPTPDESPEPTTKAAPKPKGAKAPKDHQAKAPKPDAQGNLNLKVRGIELAIAADALDDFELLDDLNELEQNENAGRLPSVLRRLIGPQWPQVMQQLRGPNGRVSVEDGALFVSEVLEAANPNS